MNYSVIIAEFNPLTNGHKYIIDQTKKLFPSDGIIIVMSGNYVQRGEPAIIDKFIRAHCATTLGVDAVVELPLIYSISSAEDFAYGGVQIASLLHNVKRIVFGSECGDINTLVETANFLNANESNLKIKKFLISGNSYASSIINSLPKNIKDIMKTPNNILAVEYIKAINKLNLDIEPITIKRINNYNSNQLTPLASATAIRKELSSGNIEHLDKFLPLEMYNHLKSCNKISNEILFSMLLYKLETSSTEELNSINNISEGLEFRIKNIYSTCRSLDELIEKISTKRYPKSKIRRILLNIIFNINKADIDELKKVFPPIKLLSVGKRKTATLQDLAKSKSTVITNFNDYEKLSPSQMRFVNIGNTADNIYSFISNNTYNMNYKNKI